MLYICIYTFIYEYLCIKNELTCVKNRESDIIKINGKNAARMKHNTTKNQKYNTTNSLWILQMCIIRKIRSTYMLFLQDKKLISPLLNIVYIYILFCRC